MLFGNNSILYSLHNMNRGPSFSQHYVIFFDSQRVSHKYANMQYLFNPSYRESLFVLKIAWAFLSTVCIFVVVYMHCCAWYTQTLCMWTPVQILYLGLQMYSFLQPKCQKWLYPCAPPYPLGAIPVPCLNCMFTGWQLVGSSPTTPTSPGLSDRDCV